MDPPYYRYWDASTVRSLAIQPSVLPDSMKMDVLGQLSQTVISGD
jgi:hypothetical protein